MSETTVLGVGIRLFPYEKFKMALKSKEVQRQYPNILMKFFDFCKFEGPSIDEKATKFLEFVRSHSQEDLEDLIIRFILLHKNRIDQKEITAGTLRNYLKAIKLFCRMNRINITWDVISSSLPRVKQYANDRIPTIEEIQKLIAYPDRRLKPIVLLSISTGIRVGAWDYMKWKHITRIDDEKGAVLAAKLVVYPDEPEQYYTFMTPEAYNTIKDWMDFRASFGEEITGESWILRNTWQKVQPRYSHRVGLAKYPKPFKSTGVKTLVGRALQIQGIRSKLDSTKGEKKHDWKTLHGFRKFFKTQTERVMKSLNVEILMGHDIGLAKSYYKPPESELLQDYIRAIGLLTINHNNRHLEKEIAELRDRNQNNEYVIKAKLQEKDDAVSALSDKVMQLMDEVRNLKRIQKSTNTDVSI